MSAEALWGEYEAISTQPLASSACALRSRSVIMRELTEQIAHVGARDDLPALIVGEAGVGKGCYAAAIHAQSARAQSPLVTASCLGSGGVELEQAVIGSPPGDGDATGSVGGQSLGADGGTLFLSEIGALGTELQATVQRLLEAGRFRTASSGEEIRVDVRVLASSSLDLVDEVNEGRFREDLYYRFSAMPVAVPPIRARGDEEVIELLDHVARTLAFELPGSPSRFAPQSLHRLVRYPWPGNLREMRNVLERAMVAARGAPAVDLPHLPHEVRDPAGFDGEYVARTVAEVERLHIERTLGRHRQNRTHAAIELGISRATLIKKIREYGLAASSRGSAGGGTAQ